MFNVSWHNEVNGNVKEALRHLPECEVCSHELYLRLLQLRQKDHTRIVVVSDSHGPVALSGMIRRGPLVWEPITNWLFPGSGFPARRGMEIAALAAINREVPLSWWRMNRQVPEDRCVRNVEVLPTYKMDQIPSREDYWRRTNYLRTIKNARNRCKNLEVVVGDTRFAHEVIAGWHVKWTGGEADDDIVRRRVLLADALENEGRHLTVCLLDNGRLVAGSTNFVHRGELVAGVLYVSPDYRRLSAGVRLIDIAFDLAESRGLAAFDLGGAADYKKVWAPEDGWRAKFIVSSSSANNAARAVQTLQRLKYRFRSAVEARQT